MASHVSPTLTVPAVGLHISGVSPHGGLLSVAAPRHPGETAHLPAEFGAQHHAEPPAMYHHQNHHHQHHHRAKQAMEEARKPPERKQPSPNSAYGNRSSSFMIDDILSKSSSESPVKEREQNGTKEHRALGQVFTSPEMRDRRDHRDQREHVLHGPTTNGNSSPPRVGDGRPNMPGKAPYFLTQNSREVSPSFNREGTFKRNAVSPRPLMVECHGSDQQIPARYEARGTHHLIQERRSHPQNGDPHFLQSSMPRIQHHTIHHHHQPSSHIDSREGERQLLPADARNSRTGSTSPAGSPRGPPHPARPTPIHPSVLHTSSTNQPTSPVPDIYGRLSAARATGPEPLATVPTASLPGAPAVNPHAAPNLSVMYDPLAAATLASPYLQAPLGPYPAPAVYSLPPYTRPEHYAFLARHHHACKYTHKYRDRRKK